MLFRLQNLYKVPLWTVLFISNEYIYLVEFKMLLLCLAWGLLQIYANSLLSLVLKN